MVEPDRWKVVVPSMTSVWWWPSSEKVPLQV
jgi:hypothetical protein